MKRYSDILAIDAIICVLAVLIVTSQLAVLRIMLGVPAVLFFPGYMLSAALFPKKSSLTTAERITLSIGTSAASVILIGLFLNYTWWGINVTSTTVSVFLFTLAASAAAYQRRRRLTAEEPAILNLNTSFSWWRKAAGVDKVIMTALAISVIMALATSFYMSARPKPEGSFTEFYLLNPTGMAEKYTREMALDRAYDFILGIVNREQQENSYRVETRLDGILKGELGPVVLAPGEKLEQKVQYIPDELGDNLKLEFLLYKTGESTPYTSVYLRIYVTSR